MTFEAKDILSIHEKLLEAHRIESGYRNKGTVYSIFEKTRLQFMGLELYPTATKKAAVLFEGIIRLHPFIDGNKRTALAVAQEFLVENNLIFLIPITAVHFTVQIAKTNVLESEKIDRLIDNIEKWISHRTVPAADIKKIRDLLKKDIDLLTMLLKISQSNRGIDFLKNTVDYWLAKDIYPDNDIKFEDLIKFHTERLNGILKFVQEI